MCRNVTRIVFVIYKTICGRKAFMALCMLLAFAGASPCKALEWGREQIEKTAGWKDKELLFNFVFQNKSAKTVTLRDVATSCACAEVDRSVLRTYAPGDKGVLEAAYHIGDRTGRRLETIYLETDEPGKKVAELRMMVVIPELVVFRPGVVSWNPGEAPLSKSLVVRWQGPGRGKLLKVSTGDPSWKVVATPADVPNEWLVTVTPGSTATERIEKIQLDFQSSDTGPRRVLGYGVVQKSP